MADTTIHDGQELNAALDKIAKLGLRRRKNWMCATLTNSKKFFHVVMYFITLMLLLLFLMIHPYSRR